MKSLTSVKKATFVGLSSLVLALGLFAAPVAFAKENGNKGDHRENRSEHRENRSERREGDREGRGERREGDREGRGERFEGRWDWDRDND